MNQSVSNRPEKTHIRIYKFLGSKELTIGLLAVLSFFLALSTTPWGESEHLWIVIRILLGIMVLNLSLCTIQRFKNLSKAVLFIHIGIILTFIGGAIGLLGYVATVNIYEGTSTGLVYRWDIEEDVHLGVNIAVEKLHEEYYPVPVKVGVMKDGEKHELFILSTGESFEIDNYSVLVDSIDIYQKRLLLSVYDKVLHIGMADTSGNSDLPPDFPFEFKLVAFVDPVIKYTRVDLKLLKGDTIVHEGSTEINSPLQWEGLSYYHTATNTDDQGRPYIGLQITKDPGLYYAYTGFSLISIGAVLYLLLKLRGRRQNL